MKAYSILAVLACSAALPCARGEVKFADPFADGVVLQRGRPVPVWGTAKPSSVVSLSFGGHEVSCTADADGRWRADLPPMDACREGRELKAVELEPGFLFDSETSAATVSDVLVGDVWFVCGQSNTEFPLCGTNPHFRDRNGAAIASITRLPLVRFCYQSAYKCAETPKTKACLPVRWQPFTPENLLEGHSFSAIGAYFAIYVHQATGVPLGLVGAYWGGTGIDPWTPREGTASRPDLKDILDWKASLKWDGKNPKSVYPNTRVCDQAGVLWNEMVAPWCPFAIKGFLWYQGCTNSREPERYCSKMHALYNGWSRKFGNPDLKLYFVQLAPWGFKGIATIQEAQADFEREQPNAGMAVINDIGNLTDIHPNEKGTVGLRLARMALKRDYGFTDIEDRSPQLRSATVEGDTFVLTFDHARRLYLYNRDFTPVTPFEVAGADGVFKPAKIVNLQENKRRDGVIEYRGLIDGGPKLVVRAEGVDRPVRLRYCHSHPWLGTVYNEANLPLAAFHVDAETAK